MAPESPAWSFIPPKRFSRWPKKEKIRRLFYSLGRNSKSSEFWETELKRNLAASHSGKFNRFFWERNLFIYTHYAITFTFYNTTLPLYCSCNCSAMRLNLLRNFWSSIRCVKGRFTFCRIRGRHCRGHRGHVWGLIMNPVTFALT